MNGTDKQNNWALSIQDEFRRGYPDKPLPPNTSSKFWIDHRHLDLDSLWKAHHTSIYSACTKSYPDLMQEDIKPLLQNMSGFAVFDTETSGLMKDKAAEVTELAIVALETGDILFHSLFRPLDIQGYFTSEARKMHAFPEEAYFQAPPFPEKWNEIKAIFNRYHPVAYNAEFDITMLRQTAHLWNLPAPRMRATCAMKLFQAFMTTELSNWRTYKMEEACRLMSIDHESYGTPHTSLADALATRELLLQMRREVEEEFPF